MLASLVSACTVGPLGQHHQVGTLTIGADLPLSGDDAVDGLPVRDAISLALRDHASVCGASSHADACVRLQPSMLDDVTRGIHDPATGSGNIKTLAAEPAVVAVIGPLYDGVARAELPIADSLGLALVSPANTDVCLTQEPPDGECQGSAARLRGHHGNSYFRVVTTQLDEGPAAADLAYRTLGKRRAFVVKDDSALAQNLATAFSLRFTHDGGRIADQGSADVVYDAASDLISAAALRRQLAVAVTPVALIGTDALASDQFAKAAGPAARGSYFTVAGPDPANTRSATAFSREYRDRFGQAPTATSLAAFDATGVVIAAIGRAIDDAGGNRPTRAQVLDELAKTSAYAGAMGTFGFDARGDTTLRWVSAYQWLAPTDPAGQFTAEIAVG